MSKENQEAPSIGSVELSFDPVGNRVRRIVPDPVNSEGELISILVNAGMYAESKGATRTMVRAIIPDCFMSAGEYAAICARWNVEAVIPLSGRFENNNFVYFTSNSPTRFSSREVLVQEMQLIKNITAKPVSDPAATLEKTLRERFILEFLDGELNETDLLRLVEMYAYSFNSYPFEISDPETIKSMVADPNIHVCAARSELDGQLYAVSATEIVKLPGSGFTMREMGDSAKMPGVNGLNAPLKLMLIAESYRRDENIDLLFCESRAALGAVNYINHKNGMQYCGMLPKHTKISGPYDVPEVELDGENGIYGNMNVWALNENQIKAIYRLLAE